MLEHLPGRNRSYLGLMWVCFPHGIMVKQAIYRYLVYPQMCSWLRGIAFGFSLDYIATCCSYPIFLTYGTYLFVPFLSLIPIRTSVIKVDLNLLCLALNSIPVIRWYVANSRHSKIILITFGSIFIENLAKQFHVRLCVCFFTFKKKLFWTNFGKLQKFCRGFPYF